MLLGAGARQGRQSNVVQTWQRVPCFCAAGQEVTARWTSPLTAAGHDTYPGREHIPSWVSARQRRADGRSHGIEGVEFRHGRAAGDAQGHSRDSPKSPFSSDRTRFIRIVSSGLDWFRNRKPGGHAWVVKLFAFWGPGSLG